jgi:hypothetical protein
MKKKPKKGGKPDAKPQTKIEPVESFFNFFKPPAVSLIDCRRVRLMFDTQSAPGASCQCPHAPVLLSAGDM